MEAIKSSTKPSNSKKNNYFNIQINKAFNLTLVALLTGLLISFVVNIFENNWKVFDTILYLDSSTYLSNSFHSNFQLVFIYVISFICLLGLSIIIKTYVEDGIIQNVKLVKNLNKKNKEIISKNIELENFAYLISHDLKSPLQVMNGFTDLIAKDVERNETKNLKKETVKSQLDLNKKDTTITYDYLGKLEGKESLVKILFQNLIENGLKYNKSEKPTIHITSETDKTKKIIKVIDNGIGIDESNRENVFHLFKRLHNSGEFKGTGIGLATCKKITEKHLKGKIAVHENPGGGSVFSISI